MIIHIYDEQIGYIIKSCIGLYYNVKVVDNPNTKCDILIVRDNIEKYDQSKTIYIDKSTQLVSNKLREIVRQFLIKHNLLERKQINVKSNPTNAEIQTALKQAKTNKKK